MAQSKKPLRHIRKSTEIIVNEKYEAWKDPYKKFLNKNKKDKEKFELLTQIPPPNGYPCEPWHLDINEDIIWINDQCLLLFFDGELIINEEYLVIEQYDNEFVLLENIPS